MRPALVDGLRVLAAAAAFFPAAGAAAQRTYVAPTSATVFSTTEQRMSDPPQHQIYIENRSTVPVTVFSIHLSGCSNIKQSCNPRSMNLRLGPGQRRLATRVEPKNPMQGFNYRFGFSWHADSAGLAAVAALAASGDAGAREQLSARQRADSLERASPGSHYKELSRDDFVAITGRASALRAIPDSLVLTPGERTTMDRIRLVVVDSQGVVLGRTRWVRWQAPTDGPVQFTPPEQLVARHPGRAVLRFSLAGEAQALLARPLADLDVPVVAAYPHDPRAPSFAGLAVDADRQSPLACTTVALEDSAQNVVSRDRTSRLGTFVLNAPRPGTYRVRLETFGWAPAHGQREVANADEVKQGKYAVRFTELLIAGERGAEADDFQHAAVASVLAISVGAPARPGAAPKSPSAPAIRGVTLSGSASLPVLGIVGNAPEGTSWVQIVVDSMGHVDPASALFPAGTDPATVATVKVVLPRVRFAPARQAGTPTCELLQLQVNVSGGPR